jgi:hypothetical protein
MTQSMEVPKRDRRFKHRKPLPLLPYLKKINTLETLALAYQKTLECTGKGDLELSQLKDLFYCFDIYSRHLEKMELMAIQADLNKLKQTMLLLCEKSSLDPAIVMKQADIKDMKLN